MGAQIMILKRVGPGCRFFLFKLLKVEGSQHTSSKNKRHSHLITWVSASAPVRNGSAGTLRGTAIKYQTSATIVEPELALTNPVFFNVVRFFDLAEQRHAMTGASRKHGFLVVDSNWTFLRILIRLVSLKPVRNLVTEYPMTFVIKLLASHRHQYAQITDMSQEISHRVDKIVQTRRLSAKLII